MTLVDLLIFGLVVVIIYIAIQWLVKPEPLRSWVLPIFGVVALIVLVSRLWPGLLHFRVGG